MTTILSGALLDGEASGTLTTSSRISKIRVSTTAALTGTLTLSDKSGTLFTSSAGLNGVQTVAADGFGPVFYSLSNPADVGKASVSWEPR